MAAVEERIPHILSTHRTEKAVMKSPIWFLLGFCFMVLVSFLLGSCSAEGNFTAASVDAESFNSRARPSLRVSVHKPSSGDAMAPIGVSVGGQTVLLGVYTIHNESTHVEVVRSFTVKSATGKNAFLRIGYAWGESPEEVLDATTPSLHGYVTFLPNALRARMPSRSVRTVRLIGVTANVGASLSSLQSGDVAVVELVSLVGMGDVPASFEGPLVGPSYVLRRSQPRILAHPLADTALRAEKILLFSWGVYADAAGDVSVKQFGLHLDLTNVEACEFQLRRNTRLVASNDIRVTNLAFDAADLTKGCIRSSSDLALTFANEEFVRAGTETMFTLRARMTPLGKDARVTSGFLRVSLPDARTTELACVGRQALRLGSMQSGVPAVLWSDISAHPHSDVPCRSSKDWIGDAFIADLSASQTLR